MIIRNLVTGELSQSRFDPRIPLFSLSPRKHTITILTPVLESKTGVYRVNIMFLISAQKHRLWVLV